MDSLCKKCNKFYGAPQKQNLCSMCYKYFFIQSRQYIKSKNIQQEVKKIQIKQPPVPVAPKQTDHSKCFKCNKKIGLLGFKCNVCQCSYCKNHRLPEDHLCEVNFVELGKKQMEKNKQTIIAPKVEQI